MINEYLPKDKKEKWDAVIESALKRVATKYPFLRWKYYRIDFAYRIIGLMYYENKEHDVCLDVAYEVVDTPNIDVEIARNIIDKIESCIIAETENKTESDDVADEYSCEITSTKLCPLRNEIRKEAVKEFAEWLYGKGYLHKVYCEDGEYCGGAELLSAIDVLSEYENEQNGRKENV